MMNGVKRSHLPTKANSLKHTGKLKEPVSSSRHKSEGKLIETDLTNIPIIRQVDTPRLLPKYTAAKSEDGNLMYDLDQLQYDLEKLLSTSALRIRYLLAEIGEIDKNQDNHERKAHEKTSLKRKRPDEKLKSKDFKNGMRVVRKNYSLPVNKFVGDQDIPKVTLPKNDNSDKFWTSIEPFCASINKDDIAFLETLIQEFSKEINFKIPDIGEHYANSWGEEVINDEQNFGKSPSKKSPNMDFNKNDLQSMMETLSASQTQKLLGNLIEDRIRNALPKNGENCTRSTKLKFSNLNKIKPPINQKVGLCLEKRLKRQFAEQGLLNGKTANEDSDTSGDEILKELNKCQEELSTINEHNIEELKQLTTVAINELRCNELKEKLDKVDRQVLELYNRIVMTRKKARLGDGLDFDKAIFTEQITKEFEAQADALLKQQIELNRKINGLGAINTISDELVMNGPKRYFVQKNVGRCNGKLKDILLSSRHKSEGKATEPDLANIPVIKQADNARLLPKYPTILAKLGNYGVSMDDLDELQQYLEKLLLTSAARIRFLLSEIGEIDRNEEFNDRKAHDKASQKRKRPDEKPRFRELKNGMKVVKKQYGLPVNKFVGDGHLHQRIPKVTLPKNDNSDKFWTSIQPYCLNVTKDDVTFLDGLIQEFSKEIDIRIPNIGEHYATNWTDDISNDEPNHVKSIKKSSGGSDPKKNGLHSIIETFSTPQTQKLLAALLEERILNPLPKNGDNGTKIAKLKSFDFSKLKIPSTNHKLGTCLDTHLKEELLKQGIITTDDLNKNMPEDEILTEIKKCQEELVTVNSYNMEELNKLRSVVCNELQSNELKEHLEEIDKQVLDLYNKINIARKTKLCNKINIAQQEEGDEFDKAIFTEQITKEYEAQADALLKQQIDLNREINGLTDMHMLY
ncbi:hypothetical protein NQ315_010139 [Exocentrus adspersus]|uniref:Transcriptional adapter 3 n=1 Tax=Exocentrus adspersus TaxID=1586481 RepID=A0AAV8WAB9_9CUCU|nr:hypothetical protein NQ315_010139 [Exocentrus adspersus]